MKKYGRIPSLGFIIASVCCAFLGNIFAQVSKPILRIETGSHTQEISSIAVDDNNRYLVSASKDKTLRVWDLETKKLLRVIRVPIGRGNYGQLERINISPDGSIIAAICNESIDGFEKIVFLFERITGKIIKRIDNKIVNPKGEDELIEVSDFSDLKFSRDGNEIAMFGSGLAIYSLRNQSVVFREAVYSNTFFLQSGILSFDSKGNLALADSQNRLHIYSNFSGNWKETKLIKLSSNISSLIFSPDSTKLGVTLWDFNNPLRTIFKVYSTDSYALIKEMVDFVATENIISKKDADWLPDGKSLISLSINGLRVWDINKTKINPVIKLSNDVFWDFKALKNGKTVFATFDGRLGLIDSKGQIDLLGSDSFLSYGFKSDEVDDFRLSPTGKGVQVCIKRDKNTSANKFLPCELFLSFELTDFNLIFGNKTIINWKPAITEDKNFIFTKDDTSVKLNGKQINLVTRDLEGIKSGTAISPDKEFILVNDAAKLHLFNKQGNKIWESINDDYIRKVNISENGEFAVATFFNGIIRWYRMTDGGEVIALFVDKNRNRWVLWTPSGYYNASSNGEDLVGWQINNGKESSPDFYPVGLFRNQYYRPDIINKILFTLDEAKAVQIANEEVGRRQQQTDIAKQLPPVVEIINPRDSTEISNNQVTIRYNVRSNEPVTNIKALIDGRPTERGVGNRLANSSEITILIPERDCEVSLIAENRFAPSVPATIRLKWKSKIPIITAENLKPKLYILAVGVSKYSNSEFNLGLPSKDAKDFVNAMMEQKGGLYRDVEVKLLTNEQATRDNVVDGLEWITKATTNRDVAMVFMAGHGINDNLNRYYFASHNFNPDSLLRTGVTFSDIKNAVETIAGKTLFFIDTCHSGNSIGTSKRRDGAVDINGMVNELSSAENGAIVFNASTGKQVSLEDASWGNGAFTKALVEGLSGKAATADGRITVKSLDFYISERVKQLTGGRQTPTTAIPNTVPDFPIAARF